MSLKKIQDKAMLKMVAPLIDSFLMPFLKQILEKAAAVKINTETESEVGLLLLARGEKIIACAPVFSKNDCIVRYEPMNEKGSETVDLTDLIKDFKP